MNALASEFRDVLSGPHEPPCLSLYQPTHRRQPDRRQDSIRFGNLVKALEDSLRRDYPARDAQPLLAPFHALGADRAFWNHGQDGLAVFAAADLFRVYQLPRSVPERTTVADGFHIKPLLRIVQSADRFHILGLNRREACLFEGNRDGVTEIDLVPGVGRMVTDMPIGDVDPGMRATRVYESTLGAPTTRLGSDATQDVVDHDTDQFFRLVDQTVIARHSRPAGLPLVLAALPEYHHRFRAISQNPLLANVTIDVFPDAISQDALRDAKQSLGNHPIETHLPADLPIVRIDPVRIKEVLVQLLENAAKYSLAESPIHVTGEVKAGMVTISVADHGPGIDDFEQSLIFDKFYRGRNQRATVQGTGMGLAIVKAIVEAHGGHVGVTSQLGRGSVFFFSVPVA